MTKHVFSTLSADNQYDFHAKAELGQIPAVAGSIMIKGGTGVMQKNLQTPLGVHTAVSDEDYAKLEAHPVFQVHKKNGFIQVRDSKVDTEVAAADMNTRDGGAQLNDHDFEDGKAPTAGKPDKK